MHYKNLKAEMAREGIKIGVIAKFLELRYATVWDKLNGKSRFYSDEAIKIKKEFFPMLQIEYLFDNEEQRSA